MIFSGSVIGSTVTERVYEISTSTQAGSGHFDVYYDGVALVVTQVSTSKCMVTLKSNFDEALLVVKWDRDSYNTTTYTTVYNTWSPTVDNNYYNSYTGETYVRVSYSWVGSMPTGYTGITGHYASVARTGGSSTRATAYGNWTQLYIELDVGQEYEGFTSYTKFYKTVTNNPAPATVTPTSVERY